MFVKDFDGRTTHARALRGQGPAPATGRCPSRRSRDSRHVALSTAEPSDPCPFRCASPTHSPPFSTHGELDEVDAAEPPSPFRGQGEVATWGGRPAGPAVAMSRTEPALCAARRSPRLGCRRGLHVAAARRSERPARAPAAQVLPTPTSASRVYASPVRRGSATARSTQTCMVVSRSGSGSKARCTSGCHRAPNARRTAPRIHAGRRSRMPAGFSRAIRGRARRPASGRWQPFPPCSPRASIRRRQGTARASLPRRGSSPPWRRWPVGSP